MPSEENEVTLIVEGHDLPSFEFGVLGKKAHEKSGNSPPDHSIEII